MKTVAKTFVLDELDEQAVNAALARRQAMRIDGECILPDYDSDLAGVLLAEICRGWMEMLGMSNQNP